jgi:hypothetical protein
MDEKTGSQRVLERTYSLVVSELRQLMHGLVEESNAELDTLKRLAEELNISVPSTSALDADEEETIRQVTWFPIAQECVVTLLRAMLQGVARNETKISREQLTQMCDDAIDAGEFHRIVGLNRDDARLALGVAANTFLTNNLFSTPVNLLMDGYAYTLRREGDALVAQALTQQQSID